MNETSKIIKKKKKEEGRQPFIGTTNWIYLKLNRMFDVYSRLSKCKFYSNLLTKHMHSLWHQFEVVQSSQMNFLHGFHEQFFFGDDNTSLRSRCFFALPLFAPNDFVVKLLLVHIAQAHSLWLCPLYLCCVSIFWFFVYFSFVLILEFALILFFYILYIFFMQTASSIV